MIAGSFAVGLLVIAFGIICILHNIIGIFPFDFPHFEDTTTIIVIGLAIVVFGMIFRIPTEK